MARGWESKSVEDQLEEAARRKREAAVGAQMNLSPEALQLRERMESLRLTRSRLTEQLTRARADAHRRMLTQSLEEIARQLEELEP